ncbi:putative chaperone protein [Granulicella aggregans]|uniref:Putative chaperone protein n=1 Tax=Granulicella aggregans TaxID=474949 RepID=A0A7W7ZGG2_9BACT|nr:Hsp70 family protein [Granulicella aggregans]MBB5059470.1 putative chaperone protein [Granulicella aggregans]
MSDANKNHGPYAGARIGIDFGTTNSSVAIYKSDGSTELVSFPTLKGLTESYRSVLYLEQVKQAGRTQLKGFTGPQAIEHYLHAESPGRLIQSLKSYLPSKSLTGTEVFGRRYTLEELIARILTDLRLATERHVGGPVRHATVGRPVRFVAAETAEDDAFATTRLETAFKAAGFESVEFEYEPVAAAYAYESSLTDDELILIGDFGGGTSDFSLLHVGPGVRARGRSKDDLLGNAGLGLAGDAFDARIVRKLVSPALGSDSFEKTFSHAADRPAPIIPAVPAWIYANLERWHYLSFLKTRNVTEMLKAARARAQEPEKVAALITLIDEDLGYQLHQAVQRLKVDLSSAENAEFRFRDGSLEIVDQVSRADFEGWIRDDLAAIESTVDGLMNDTGIAREKVNRVFLTGGTSFVPAVRGIFDRRFGRDRVRTGNEFTSVAMGLALSAAQ